MSTPPAQVHAVGVAAPSSTADTAAITTSASMMSAVTCAGSRAAPYCSARLPLRKASVSASAHGSHETDSAGGAPPARPASTSAPDIASPPANMASTRASRGVSRQRRSRALVSAKQKPPSSARKSAAPLGSGQAPPGRCSTSTSPASASPRRASAAGVGRSPSSHQARPIDHTGIR